MTSSKFKDGITPQISLDLNHICTAKNPLHSQSLNCWCLLCLCAWVQMPTWKPEEGQNSVFSI